MTGIANPDGGSRAFTYQGGGTHRLARDQYGSNLENNYAYTSTGVLGTLTWGAATSASRTTFESLVSKGLSALNANTNYVISTDGTGAVTRTQYDARGRVVGQVAPDGGRWSYAYTNGFLTGQTDPLGNTTAVFRSENPPAIRRDGSTFPAKDGGLIPLAGKARPGERQGGFAAKTPRTSDP